MKKLIVLIFLLVVVWMTNYYYISQVQHSRYFGLLNTSSSGYTSIFVWRPLKPSPYNVFFVETSCAFKPSVTPGLLHLSKRQACSIYSTAVLNPNHRIIIVHTCPLVQDYSQRWEEDWPELLSLKNVDILETEISLLLSETPVASLLNGKLNSSTYPVEHTSDLVRLALLYKYDGTYLDTDIISIRPLDDLGHNYVGAQQGDLVNNAIMNFGMETVGHQFVENVLSKLKVSFQESAWGLNGPHVITSELRKFCKIGPNEPLDKLGKLDCGLTVHPPALIYPLPFWKWEQFMDETAWPSVRDKINNAYIVHFWNKLSKDTIVRVGSQQPYGIIAANYCSPIYHKNGNMF